jgi:hypothetical protein
MSADREDPAQSEETARRRARLWDRVVAAQAAVLPAGAPAWLWKPEHGAARQTALEMLVREPLERATTCLRVLGAAHPEWYVGLPLDRMVEPYLHDSFPGELVAEAVGRALEEPLGLAGAARWLIHARGVEHLPPREAARHLPVAARWALEHPVPRNRTETLELLAEVRSPFVVPLLHEVLAGGFTPREAEPEERELYHLFGDPETFFVEEDLVRGTSDRAFSALLLARRGERGIRPRVRVLMETAGTADFHALALALEALDAPAAPRAPSPPAAGA